MRTMAVPSESRHHSTGGATATQTHFKIDFTLSEARMHADGQMLAYIIYTHMLREGLGVSLNVF